jgi:hypothetical protein
MNALLMQGDVRTQEGLFSEGAYPVLRVMGNLLVLEAMFFETAGRRKLPLTGGGMGCFGRSLHRP